MTPSEIRDKALEFKKACKNIAGLHELSTWHFEKILEVVMAQQPIPQDINIEQRGIDKATEECKEQLAAKEFDEAVAQEYNVDSKSLLAEIESLKQDNERLKKELDGFRAFKRNIDEALNSGDGIYRP